MEGEKLVFETVNIPSLTLKFYFVDLEVLFSRQPFLGAKAGSQELSFVMPALVVEHTPPASEAKEPQESSLSIPEKLQKKNVVVEANGGGKKEFATYFSTSLKVSVLENYGELKVTDEKGTMLAGVYTKVFARFKSGKTQFYKDGYTDMRGKFDYATLSGASLSAVARFALLVTHPEFGSMAREADPPAGLDSGPGTTLQAEQKKIGGTVMSGQRAQRYIHSKAWNRQYS